MNLVLLGATGFTGSAVLRGALARRWQVNAFVRDLDAVLPSGVRTIIGALPEVPRALFPDEPCIVVHLASKQIDLDGTGYWRANVGGARALMATLPPQVKGCVFGSSMSVYGQGKQHWISESHPIRPQTALAKARASAEAAIHRGANARGIGAWILRPRFVIGIGERHAIPGLVKLARRRLCPGNGRQRLAMVDVDDYASLILHLAESLRLDASPSTRALNITYRQAPTLAELLATAQRALGMTPGWRRLPLWEPAMAAMRLLPLSRDLATKLELVGLEHSANPEFLASVAPPGWVERDPIEVFRRAFVQSVFVRN